MGTQSSGSTYRHHTSSGTTNNFNGGTNGNSRTDFSNRGSVGNRSGGRANVDVSSYRRNITAQHHYHFGAYREPQGYSYRRWGYGDRLPSIYFGRDYWISDYGNFGLMDPPYGYVWVRYGPDALLIDEYTGEIVQVVYGQFY